MGRSSSIRWGRSRLRMKREYPESPLIGEWSLPGGVLECGETLRDAAIREAREETGLVVEVGEMLGVYERVIRSEDARVRYHYVLIDFLCRAVAGELKAGSDAAEAGWFTREELPALKLAFDANDVVLKGLARTHG